MITINIDVSDFNPNFFDLLAHLQNNVLHKKLMYCDRSIAEYRVVERWKDNQGKVKQYTNYIKSEIQ